MSVTEVATKLVQMCQEGQNVDAIDQFYAADIVSVEAAPFADMPAEMAGLEAVKGKNTWWFENNELHGGEVTGPFIHGDDKFAAIFSFDITPKGGERNNFTEIGVYTVANGKIVREEFYSAPMP